MSSSSMRNGDPTAPIPPIECRKLLTKWMGIPQGRIVLFSFLFRGIHSTLTRGPSRQYCREMRTGSGKVLSDEVVPCEIDARGAGAIGRVAVEGKGGGADADARPHSAEG